MFEHRDRNSRNFDKDNTGNLYVEYLNIDDFWADLSEKSSEIGQEIYSNISSAKNVQSLNLDAEFDLHITFLEALNGTKMNLLVNDEQIEFEIPKGNQTGKKSGLK